jgi:hypothetical protein
MGFSFTFKDIRRDSTKRLRRQAGGAENTWEARDLGANGLW